MPKIPVNPAPLRWGFLPGSAGSDRVCALATTSPLRWGFLWPVAGVKLSASQTPPRSGGGFSTETKQVKVAVRSQTPPHFGGGFSAAPQTRLYWLQLLANTSPPRWGWILRIAFHRKRRLRHAHAVTAAAHGSDWWSIAQQLGHARPSFTMDRYGHFGGDFSSDYVDI